MTGNENIKKNFRISFNKDTKKIIIEIDADAFNHLTPSDKVVTDSVKAAKYYTDCLNEFIEESDSPTWSLFGIILDDINESIEESAFFEGVDDIEDIEDIDN